MVLFGVFDTGVHKRPRKCQLGLCGVGWFGFFQNKSSVMVRKWSTQLGPVLFLDSAYLMCYFLKIKPRSELVKRFVGLYAIT